MVNEISYGSGACLLIDLYDKLDPNVLECGIIFF